ncbi:MAG: M28 family peptidase [Verrucomicrobia bacterium]|nr:M28 family peptidase [Verrucomicrobiota bacterium]
MKRKRIMSVVRILCMVGLVLLVTNCFVAQPTFRQNHASTVRVSAERLKDHVSTLSQTFHPRDWEHPGNLEKCADYITTHFTKAGATVESQVFAVQGKRYRNVIGRFGAGQGGKVVVGAHYDSYSETPGADDNASGIAALIELAYLAGGDAPQRELELVAYVLEEPPFFGGPEMGSAIHAKSIAGEKARIKGVIVLEMVGCFKDEAGSQSYPTSLLRLLYPSRGNFIAVAGRWDQGDWIKAVKVGMKGTTALPVYSIRAPALLPGIDFSDHYNYWPYGLKAAMITDTSFYRNKAYHTSEDTPERLDYGRMSKVVVAVFEAIRSI